jgi:hypothetical protein
VSGGMGMGIGIGGMLGDWRSGVKALDPYQGC